MPLKKGCSRATIGHNIHLLVEENKTRRPKRSHSQIVAISLSTARRTGRGKCQKKLGRAAHQAEGTMNSPKPRRVRVQTDTITAPAHWASALINGDESSFSYHNDEVDYQNYLTWLEKLSAKGWSVTGIVDDSERFTWDYNRYGGNAKGGDVVDYQIIKHPKPRRSSKTR